MGYEGELSFMSLPVQDMEEGVCRSESSGSDCSSPRGPKGGGTLKTCAVCLEDYRSASTVLSVCCNAALTCLLVLLLLRKRGCAHTVYTKAALIPLSKAYFAVNEERGADIAGAIVQAQVHL